MIIIISHKVELEKQLDHLRENLLDLTMRNPLLNFRPGAKSIQVINDIAPEIYDLLILQEKKLQFLPTKQEDEPDKELSSEEDDPNLTEEEAGILWELSTPEDNAAKGHQDLFLHTKFNSMELQKRLRYINQQAKSVFEEQGYNILYLALGFLEWREYQDSQKIRKAPLILIPVKLTRKKVGDSFKLNWTGEDILTNISLQSKLEEQGVYLADFEMLEEKEVVNEYLQAVKKSVSKIKNFNVLNETYLSFFSFTKFVMFQDLNPKSWPESYTFNKNPIIKDLFDKGDESYDKGFSEEDVDRKLKSKDVYNVLDADSSQIAVIEDGKSGRNLVVEGPPGTGKSQTIVNLIAEIMASGKTVLFVSEKMAALEVVKNRLDHIGLGEFCLELHSHKSNKLEVLNQLQKTLYEPVKPPVSLKHKFDKLDTIKSELNKYAEIIHENVGELEFSPFELFGIKEEALIHFQKKEMEMPYVEMGDLRSYTDEEWRESITKLSDITELLKTLKPISQHPWRLSRPDIILPADENKINNLLYQSINILNNISNEITTLINISGVKTPKNMGELDESLEISQMIANSVLIDEEIINNLQWDDPKSTANRLIKELREFQLIIKDYNPSTLDKNLKSISIKFKKLSNKRLKFLSGDYKKTKLEIESFYFKETPHSDEDILTDLNQLIKCKKIRDNIRASKKEALSCFGSQWKGEESDPENLHEFTRRIIKFRKLLSEAKITQKSIEILNSGQNKVQIQQNIDNIDKYYQNLINKIDGFIKYLKMDFTSIFHVNFTSIPFENLKSQIESLQTELPKLLIWSQYSARKRELPQITKPLIRLFENDKIDSDDIIPCFKGNFADNLLKSIFMENTVLSSFVGDLHENKIDKFIKLDQELLILNRKRITQEISQKKPIIGGNTTKRSELGILLSEFNRKRRHMPIRKLLSAAGGLIQQIKPCFMMSPLSVAQFIEPENVDNLLFDVIIFDEASQVKPEDALGAFLRGKNLVVMGDTKQLPPTSFFENMVEADDNEDYELSSLKDMESILHLCKKSGFPTKMLRWHYRSRHESLIAVSNHLFYSNQLLIYPSPSNNSEKLGLKFIHLPEAIYDSGRNSGNIVEAKAVVQAIIEHYQTYGNTKSLGVGTFNLNQRRLIDDFLEIERKKNPEIEEYFTENKFEKFFIKNLETIQGDERDVIFVSVGFGFDKNRKLSHNFGPVNREGGERRLNVLFTRAREKCVIFSNFKHSDLKLAANAPFGLRALKTFLEYAEHRQLIDYELPLENMDSPFEETVFEFLKNSKYEIHKQVGCAGFRIDLAVVNPNSQGEYLLGIECDGATYHSSPVARDRDRLRQQVLEGLGWKIHRIWSTDWYRNREETTKRLLKAIVDAENSENITEINIQKEEPSPEEIIEESFEPTVDDEIYSPEESLDDGIYTPEVNLEDPVSNYEICNTITIDKTSPLHEKSSLELSRAIIQIVDFEGPIHINEVIKRVRLYWGLKKAGKRIKDAITSAVVVAEQNDEIFIKDNFLYPFNGIIKVRRRTGDPPANIDLISPEEIEEAVKIVLKTQHATPMKDLYTQVARLFGFKSTSKKTANKIKTSIKNLIDEKELVETSNGMINIP